MGCGDGLRMRKLHVKPLPRGTHGRHLFKKAGKVPKNTCVHTLSISGGCGNKF